VGTVAEAAPALAWDEPVTVIVHPDVAADTAVSVNVPAVELAGETVTDEHDEDAVNAPEKLVSEAVSGSFCPTAAKATLVAESVTAPGVGDGDGDGEGEGEGEGATDGDAVAAVGVGDEPPPPPQAASAATATPANQTCFMKIGSSLSGRDEAIWEGARDKDDAS